MHFYKLINVSACWKNTIFVCSTFATNIFKCDALLSISFFLNMSMRLLMSTDDDDDDYLHLWTAMFAGAINPHTRTHTRMFVGVFN